MISVVIPALNEERALPQTLAHLFREHGAFEVIVVDGGSSDGTIAIIRQHPAIRLVHAPRGRASQMNAGASVATGDWLLFLHADTLLPAGALEAIRRLARDGRHIAGGFRHRFSGDDWRLRLISWMDNIRCARTSIIYGDQAMFVRRSDFISLGGFPEDAVMEDVAFCELLNQRKKPVLLDLEVLTDSRKFVQMGVWRSLMRVAVILTRNGLGLRVQRSHPFFTDVR